MPENDLDPNSLRIKVEGKYKDRFSIVGFREGDPMPDYLGTDKAIVRPEIGRIRICAQLRPNIPFPSYWIEFTDSGWRVGGKLLKPGELFLDDQAKLSYQAGGTPALAKDPEVTDN